MLDNEKVLYILRGLPGSGKSSLAKSIIGCHNGYGIIHSTDDYFMINNEYRYDSKKIQDAHLYNQDRCRNSCKNGISPIIIDNTNVRRWEAKPYVEIAQFFNYKIVIREPETSWWKVRDVEEMSRRTLHNVPITTIKKMLKSWDTDYSIESILMESIPDNKKYLPNFNNGHMNYSAPPPPPPPSLPPHPMPTYRKNGGSRNNSNVVRSYKGGNGLHNKKPYYDPPSNYPNRNGMGGGNYSSMGNNGRHRSIDSSSNRPTSYRSNQDRGIGKLRPSHSKSFYDRPLERKSRHSLHGMPSRDYDHYQSQQPPLPPSPPPPIMPFNHNHRSSYIANYDNYNSNDNLPRSRANYYDNGNGRSIRNGNNRVNYYPESAPYHHPKGGHSYRSRGSTY